MFEKLNDQLFIFQCSHSNFFQSSDVVVSMKTTGIILLAIGVVSIIIQNTFYGYVDAEGVLHDSIFLPLGVMATILGIGLLLVAASRYFLRKGKSSVPISN